MLNLDSVRSILSFISGFDEVREFFLEGYCYWFAVILENRFDGEVWYIPSENHFVCKIDELFFDASGSVLDTQDAVRWDSYDDEIHRSRLTEYCINKSASD